MEDVRKFIQEIDDNLLIEGIINRCPADMDSYVDDVNPDNPEIHGFYVNSLVLRNMTHADAMKLHWYEKPRYSVQKLLNAVNGNPLKVGNKVKFDDEKIYTWTVRAVREQFAILTRKEHYTIVDTIEGIRGPDDHYGVGYETDEQVENAMKGLFEEFDFDGPHPNIEISHRHRIPLVIAGIKQSKLKIEQLIEKYGADELKSIIDGVPAEAKYFVDAFSEALKKQGFCTDKPAPSSYGSHNFYALDKVRKAIGLW